MFKRVFPTTAVVIFLLTSCFVVPKEPDKIDFPEIDTGEITYDVQEIRLGNIVNSISTYGHFTPAVKDQLFFRYIGGRLADLYVKLDEVVSKGDVLASLDVGGLDSDLRLQEIEFEKVQLSYDMLVKTGASAFERRMAELDLESAQIRLKDMRDRKANAQLIAPFDGQITAVSYKEGDFVEPFAPVIRIENMSKLILECDPQRSRHLLADMEVLVEIGNEERIGKVVQAYDDIFALGEDALDKEQVRIEVADIPADVERNDLGRIETVLQESLNTIVVQKTYVHTFGQRIYVYLLKNGIKVEQDIVLGIETKTKVEVVEGLKPGDLLIIR